jgi:glycosyltransferase involved in cell wall biosynthesis
MDLSQVSILITSFLRPGLLADCLTGLHASLPECPIIVVDDGGLSTWPTGCEFISLPFDSGISAKRNAGIEVCRTPYLLLGCDDFDFRDARPGIEKLLGVLERHPEIDVAGGRVENNPYEGFLELVPGECIREHSLTTDGAAEFYPVDLTVNYFLARTERMLPWDARMKIGGEHGDWFLAMKEADRRVVWVPGVSISTLPANRKKMIHPDYGKYRRRAVTQGFQVFKQKRDIQYYVGFDGTETR